MLSLLALSFALRTSPATNQQTDLMRNISHLLLDPYPSELLHIYSPCHSLRSASNTRIMRVPRMVRRTQGERSFHDIEPVIWNSLPFLCQAFFFIFFSDKSENTPVSLVCRLICRFCLLFSTFFLFSFFFFSFYQQTHHQ